MTSNYNFDDDAFDDSPDWLLDDDDETAVVTTTDGGGDDDQFDQLRRKSARNESLYDEMETVPVTQSAAPARSGSSFAWSSFTPGQRLLLALLVLVDIVVILVLVLILTGIV